MSVRYVLFASRNLLLPSVVTKDEYVWKFNV